MKKITLLLCCFIAQSCAMTSLIGNYQETPFIIHSDKSTDVVWSKIIDVYAQKGITIKVIDKSSGLIVSEEYSFINQATIEMQGKLVNPKAWVVTNHFGIPSEGEAQQVKPSKIIGNFNVRIKEENGGTSVNINLTNLKAISLSRNEIKEFQVKSTGVFEKEFADMVK